MEKYGKKLRIDWIGLGFQSSVAPRMRFVVSIVTALVLNYQSSSLPFLGFPSIP
jgi:hypothetical protein